VEKSKMTTFGKIVWKEMTRFAGERSILHPLEYFAEEVVPVGPKTLRRRLDDDNWTLQELVSLQSHLKSTSLQEAINRKFAEAML